MPVRFNTIDLDALNVFYWQARASTRPIALLRHGLPSASHMFRDLVSERADRDHRVAPDLPGFGMTVPPAREKFAYTFENITKVIGLKRFAIYVCGHGAPVSFRLAVEAPDRITAIVTQNGNTSLESVSDALLMPDPAGDLERAKLEARRLARTHGRVQTRVSGAV